MSNKHQELVFDGRGINGPDKYRSRVATFTTDENADKYGRLLESAPELLEALESLFENCAMVHKRWGDNSNQKQADEAIATARALVDRLTAED